MFTQCQYESWEAAKSKDMPVIISAAEKRFYLKSLAKLRMQIESDVKKGSKVYLELFAGTGRVAEFWSKHGETAYALEIRSGTKVDLNIKAARQYILNLIRRGDVGALWFGTPCSTFSLARRGKPGRKGGPLRDVGRFIRGHPAALARPVDRSKIRTGNDCADTTTMLCREAHRVGVPWAIENPSGSRLWHWPGIKSLQRLEGVESRTLCMCMYGQPYKKSTRIMLGHCKDSGGLMKICSGRGGICQRTGKPHLVLSGTNPATNKPMTSSAQEYSKAFAEEAASVLMMAARP